MKFLNDLVTKYKLESAVSLLLLTWLSNSLFVIAFFSLVLYYYKMSKSKNPNAWFYDYRAVRRYA